MSSFHSSTRFLTAGVVGKLYPPKSFGKYIKRFVLLVLDEQKPQKMMIEIRCEEDFGAKLEVGRGYSFDCQFMPTVHSGNGHTSWQNRFVIHEEKRIKPMDFGSLEWAEFNYESMKADLEAMPDTFVPPPKQP